jgi:hypothetical protein
MNMTKDKMMYVLDPRTIQSAQSVKTHTGPRQPKACWIDNNTIISSGLDMGDRQWGVWDTRKLTERVAKGSFKPGLGVTHLYADLEHKLVYAAFRGEMMISLF